MTVEPHGAPEEEPIEKGLFDDQLSLPLQPAAAPLGYPQVRRRDGTEAPFDRLQITDAIFEAARSVGGEDRDLASSLARAVEIYLSKRFEHGGVASVDHVHDAVERVLIQMSHARTALAYARRRDRRERVRRLRQGDLKVLISELDEARFEREARESRGETLLFARRGGDREIEWDREWLARSLVRESDLSREQAERVARSVEQRLVQAGIRHITVSLVRELARVDLLERGWGEASERSRQLALSLYDTENLLRGRTPETVAQHPGATDQILARAVKREYMLAQILPPEAADAHLCGEIHVARLNTPDRFDTATHALARVAWRGVWGPGNRQIAAPASHGDTLLAHMVKWDELMRQYCSGSVQWAAVNVFFAPFLYGLEEPELQQFAQMLLYEYAYRALASPDAIAPSFIEITWTVPSALREVCVVGPAGETLEDTYGEFEHTAQQFAWALIEEVRAAAAAGTPLPAPQPCVLLEGPCLRAPGQQGFITHIAAAIAAGAKVEVRFHREAAPAPAEPWLVSDLRLPPVVLNLPRAAFLAASHDPIEVILEHMLSHAALVQKARRAFLEALAAGHDSPLGLVSWSDEEQPYMALSQAVSPIAVEGLWECVTLLTGKSPGESTDAMSRAVSLLTHLRERCAYFSRRDGFSMPLAENGRVAVGRRLTQMDAKEFPEFLQDLPQGNLGADEAPTYSTGVSVSPMAPLNPWDRAMMECAFKSGLDIAEPVRVLLPDEHLGVESVANFLTRLYRDSPCTAALFGAVSN